jgi:hypothetical protein
MENSSDTEYLREIRPAESSLARYSSIGFGLLMALRAFGGIKVLGKSVFKPERKPNWIPFGRSSYSFRRPASERSADHLSWRRGVTMGNM